MEVYTGKLNWLNYAVDDPVILILPHGLKEDAAVLMYWKWTKDSHGLAHQGPVEVKTQLKSVFSYYTEPPTIVTEARFEGYGNTGLRLEMSKADGSASLNNTLTHVYDYPAWPATLAEVYAGKLNWASHAYKELFVAIFHEGPRFGKTIGFFWGWTAEGAGGEAKGPAAYQATTYTTSESDGVIDLQSTINKNQYSVKGVQRLVQERGSFENWPLFLTLSLEGKDETSDKCELQLKATLD